MELLIKILEMSMLPLAMVGIFYSLFRLILAINAKKAFAFFIEKNKNLVLEKLFLEENLNKQKKKLLDKKKTKDKESVSDREIAEKIEDLSAEHFEHLLQFLYTNFAQNHLGNIKTTLIKKNIREVKSSKDRVIKKRQSNSEIIQQNLSEGTITDKKKYIEDIILAI